MTIVRLGEGDRFTFPVNSPFDREVIDIIKATAISRRYDSATKTWHIDETSRKPLADQLRRAGHEVLEPDDIPAPPRPKSEPGFFDVSEEEWAEVQSRAEQILAGIPKRLQGAVFREMAKRLYPDLYRSTR